MYMMTPRQQQWRMIWPRSFLALLATLQLILTCAIVGLEATSLAFDPYHSMIFAGFYCSGFFMITWISTFCVSKLFMEMNRNLSKRAFQLIIACCNRHSPGCAIHTLIENILSIIAASVLLYLDNLFLQNPYVCLYDPTCGSSYSYSSGTYVSNIFTENNYTIKLTCIRAQLACAAVMLGSNVTYIIIFLVVACKTWNISNEITPIQPMSTSVIGPVQPVIIPRQQPTLYTPPTIVETQGSRQQTIQCQNCHTLIQIT